MANFPPLSRAKARAMSQTKKLAFLGDSITRNGSDKCGYNMHAAGASLYFLTPAYPNFTTSFIQYTTAVNTCATGNGTLSFSAPNLTWQANGDTAGTPVNVSSGGYFRLPSGTAGNELIVGLHYRKAPASPMSETINVGTSQTGVLSLGNQAYARGYAAWTDILLGRPYTATYNLGITGDTTADILARMPQVLQCDADEFVLMAGINDLDGTSAATAAATAAVVKTNLLSIYTQLLAAGRFVTAVTIIPDNVDGSNKMQAIIEINSWIRQTVRATSGMDLIDAYAVMTDPTSSTGLAYTDRLASDGVHPSCKGGYIIGKIGAAALLKRASNFVDRVGSRLVFDSTIAKHGNLITTGMFPGTAGTLNTGITGTVPTSVTVNRSSGSNITAVCTAPDDGSPIARTDGIPGNWFRTVVTGFTGEKIVIFASSSISSGNYAAGDIIQLTADLRMSGTGITGVRVYISHSTPTTNVFALCDDTVVTPATSNSFSDLNGDTVQIPLRTEPYTIPTGTTLLNYTVQYWVATGGTGTFDLARMSIRKLS